METNKFIYYIFHNDKVSEIREIPTEKDYPLNTYLYSRWSDWYKNNPLYQPGNQHNYWHRVSLAEVPEKYKLHLSLII